MEQELIEKAWEDREYLKNADVVAAIHRVVALLNDGKIRVAEPCGGEWRVNEWVK